MFDSPAYDDCRAWIQKKNSKGISWENIRLAVKVIWSHLINSSKSNKRMMTGLV